tara:strand:+ start:103 stop:210 length:108 start_codon:yes stop_codon:yes gene_type:complete
VTEEQGKEIAERLKDLGTSLVMLEMTSKPSKKAIY